MGIPKTHQPINELIAKMTSKKKVAPRLQTNRYVALNVEEAGRY